MQNGARGKRADALREAGREVDKWEIDSEAGRGGGFGISHDHVLATGGGGLTGLSTSIADPSTHSSETTTGGSRASDSLDRREQGASGLVHRGARVLVRNVSHEARNGGETPARTLAAPVVTITKRRKNRHRRWRSRVGQNRSGHARLNSCNACTRKRVRVREVYSRGRPRNRAQEPASVRPHDTWAHTIEQTGTPGPVKRNPAGALQVTVVEPEAVQQEDPRVQA